MQEKICIFHGFVSLYKPAEMRHPNLVNFKDAGVTARRSAEGLHKARGVPVGTGLRTVRRIYAPLRRRTKGSLRVRGCPHRRAARVVSFGIA